LELDFVKDSVFHIIPEVSKSFLSKSVELLDLILNLIKAYPGLSRVTLKGYYLARC